MRVLVIGAGATGGYFGGRLTAAGRDVTFLVRGKRAEQMKADGLRMRTPGGEVTARPRVVLAEELKRDGQAFDLVLVSTKAYSLESAMEDFAPAVGPGTTILPMLNGMRHLEVLSGRFGAERVLGGMCRVVAELGEDGWIEQRQKEQQELAFGERTGDQHSERIERIAEELGVPGITATLSEDILATMWTKWWILASLGTICVLGRGTIGEVAAVTPYGAAMAEAVVEECTGIAAANGYPADGAMLASHRERAVEVGSTMTTSMYRDLAKGASVEADQILGDLLARAKTVKAPLVGAAYVQLKVYEAAKHA